MLSLLKYLKFLPAILVTAGAAYAAHMFIVSKLEATVSNLNEQVIQYRAQNETLRNVAATNEQTIRSLEQNMNQQLVRVTNLTVANQQLQTEKEEYLSIFRRHDLTRLALARPGLIEPRINNGTAEVFRELEQASRRIGEPNE
jgi:cell division protein FtsB